MDKNKKADNTKYWQRHRATANSNVTGTCNLPTVM